MQATNNYRAAMLALALVLALALAGGVSLAAQAQEEPPTDDPALCAQASGCRGQAPVAKDDEAKTEVIDVLANDSDPDGPHEDLRVAGHGQAAHGTVECSEEPGGTCEYTSEPGFTGTDTFEYVAGDADLGLDEATVRVLVRPEIPLIPPASPPFARDDRASVKMDRTVKVDVLANDTAADGSKSGLRVISNTRPKHGRVECDEGTCRYSPSKGFTGNDSFSYQAEDPSGGTNRATVNIRVKRAGRSGDKSFFARFINARDDEARTWVGRPLRFDFLKGEDEGMRLVFVSEPDHGSVKSDEDAGTLLYTPDQSYEGIDHFAFALVDESGPDGKPAVAVGDVGVLMLDRSLCPSEDYTGCARTGAGR